MLTALAIAAVVAFIVLAVMSQRMPRDSGRGPDVAGPRDGPSAIDEPHLGDDLVATWPHWVRINTVPVQEIGGLARMMLGLIPVVWFAHLLLRLVLSPLFTATDASVR